MINYLNHKKHTFLALLLAMLMCFVPVGESLGATYNVGFNSTEEGHPLEIKVNGVNIDSYAYLIIYNNDNILEEGPAGLNVITPEVEYTLHAYFYVTAGDVIQTNINDWGEPDDDEEESWNSETYFSSTESEYNDYYENNVANKPQWSSNTLSGLNLIIPESPEGYNGWMAQLTIEQEDENEFIKYISSLTFFPANVTKIVYKDNSDQNIAASSIGNNLNCIPMVVSGGAINGNEFDLTDPNLSSSTLVGWYMDAERSEDQLINKLSVSFTGDLMQILGLYNNTPVGEPIGIPLNESDTITIYGKFNTTSYSYDSYVAPEEYKVIYDPNGGSGQMTGSTVTYGESIELPECGFTAPEYKKFKAWLINETEYAPGDSYTVTEATTVKALWEQYDVEINFVSGGGNGNMELQKVAAGTEYELPKSGFTAVNNTKSFMGWKISWIEEKTTQDPASGVDEKQTGIAAGVSEKQTGIDNTVARVDKEVYAPGKKLVINKNTTLTAHWENNLSSGPKHVKIVTGTSIYYDGKEHKPVIEEVSIDGKVLKENTDYIIDAKGKKAGKYTAVIKGIGLYAGSQTTIDWEILKNSFTIKLFDKDGESSSVILKSGDSFAPQKDLIVKAYGQDGKEIPDLISSFVLLDSEGKTVDQTKKIKYKSLVASGASIKLHISKDSFKTENMVLADGYDKDSLELASDSNIFDVVANTETKTLRIKTFDGEALAAEVKAEINNKESINCYVKFTKPIEITFDKDKNEILPRWFVQSDSTDALGNRSNSFKLLENGEILMKKAKKDKDTDPDVYEGITVSLSAINYAGAIEIYTDAHEELAGFDENDPSFRVLYIPPVIYCGEKFVAKDDSKQASKKGCNGILQVIVKYGDKTLVLGQDYTLSYKNNVNAAKVTDDKKAPCVNITGKGKYKGKTIKQAKFTILPVSLDKIAYVDIAANYKYVFFNGKTKIRNNVKSIVKFLANNKKVKKSVYNIEIFEYIVDDTGKIIDKKPVNSDEKYPNDNKVHFFDIVAKAIGDKNGKSNYVIDSVCGEGLKVGDVISGSSIISQIDIIGTGGENNKLKVKLITNKLDYSVAGYNNKSFINNINYIKASGKVFKADDSRINIELYDSTLKNIICDKSSPENVKATAAGTYYLRFGPAWSQVDGKLINKLAEYNIYLPNDVMVTIKGDKLKSSELKISNNKIRWSADGGILKFDVKGKLSQCIKDEADNLEVYIYAPTQSSEEVGGYTVYTGSTSAKGQKVIGKLSDFLENGLPVSCAGIEYMQVGSHEIYVRAVDGKYAGSDLKLKYSIEKINYKNNKDIVKIELKDPNDPTRYLDPSKVTYSYNPAGHDFDCVRVSVKNLQNNEYTVISPGAITLKWEENEGSVIIQTSILSDKPRIIYNVEKTDITKAIAIDENELIGNTDGIKIDTNKVYYLTASKVKGGKTVNARLVQFARIGGTDEKPQYTMNELPKNNKNGYYVTNIDDVNGKALADTTGSNCYQGTYTMKFDVYEKEISKLTMTLSNGGSVALNDKNGLEAAKIALSGKDGTGIQITSVEIKYKDQEKSVETISGWENIKKVFNIYYYDNDVAVKNNGKNNATIEIGFKAGKKDGKKYPTLNRWNMKYTITKEEPKKETTQTQ